MRLRDFYVWLRWPIAFGLIAAAMGALGTPAWAWVFGSLAVAAFFIVSPGLRIAFWYARVPTAFAIIGVLALTVPEQVRYLIASTETWPQMLALPLAVFVTGVTCWFWCRWSLNLAEVGGVITGPVPVLAWNSLPRVVACMPAVAVLLAIFMASGFMELWESAVLSLLSTLAGVVLIWLAFQRRSMFDALTRDIAARDRKVLETVFLHDFAVIHEFVVAKERYGLEAAHSEFRPEGWAGWSQLALRCLPFHPRLFATPVVVFLVAAVVTMSGYGPVVWMAQEVGAAPTALLGMACLLTLLAPVTGFVAAARRWPALVLMLLWVVGATVVNENNIVRTPAPPPEYRPTLAEAARAWLQNCAEDGRNIRVVLVAAAGGASRAAVWGAAVLDALERSKEGPGIDPAKHLFAVSGISGGALGMASYVAMLDQSGAGCRGANAGNPEARMARLDKLRAGLGRDFLSPALAGMFFGDVFWRALGPVSGVLHQLGITPVERTYWLEKAWEAALATPNTSPMSRTVAAQTFAVGNPMPHLPVLFTSGTHQKTGRLVVTAPVVAKMLVDNRTVTVSAVPDAIDATLAMESDPTFAVAASNSARFPVVTAPGLLRGKDSRTDTGYVVDGGYNDNLGTTAIMAAAEALTKAHGSLAKEGGRFAGTRLHLFVVQVWSDPDRVDPDPTENKGPYTATVARCRGPQETTVAAKPATPLDMVLSPLGALTAVRGERSNSGTRPIVATYCGPWKPDEDSRHFFAFTMGPDRDVAGVRPPLNWVQPERALKAMRASDLAGFPGLGNETQLKHFQTAWCALGEARTECQASQASGSTGATPPTPRGR